MRRMTVSLFKTNIILMVCIWENGNILYYVAIILNNSDSTKTIFSLIIHMLIKQFSVHLHRKF